MSDELAFDTIFSFHLIPNSEFVLIFFIFFVSIALSFPGLLMKLPSVTSQTECGE